MLGSLALTIFLTQLIVDALAVTFVDKIGQRISIMMAHMFATVGLITMAFLPGVLPSSYIGLIMASILFSIGAGLIEVLVSPIVDSLPSEAKAASMSLAHSFYSWGQVLVIVVSTLALLIIGLDLWFILPLVWSLLPLFNFFRFMRVPLISPEEKGKQTPLKTLFRSRIFLLALLLMVCAGASEMSINQWASLFAERGLGISKVLGDLLGPCLFAAMMGIGRTWYGMKGQKNNIYKLLVVSSVLCIATYVLIAIVPVPALSLLGFAVCGLSVSLMWPGMLSMTAAGYPSGGVAMFAILALAGDLGCSVGPQLIGIIADRSSLNWGILAAVLFPGIMLIGLVALKPMMRTALTR